MLAQSLAQALAAGLDQLTGAVHACADESWQRDLWPDEAPTRRHEDGGLRGSAPWLLVTHALVCCDYDLVADFERWEAPPPVGEALVYADPTRVLTRDELLDYADHCRARAGSVLDGLTDERAARPVPDSHRYAGMLYGVLLGSIPTHLVEHAVQVEQFARRG